MQNKTSSPVSGDQQIKCFLCGSVTDCKCLIEGALDLPALTINETLNATVKFNKKTFVPMNWIRAEYLKLHAERLKAKFLPMAEAMLGPKPDSRNVRARADYRAVINSKDETLVMNESTILDRTLSRVTRQSVYDIFRRSMRKLWAPICWVPSDQEVMTVLAMSIMRHYCYMTDNCSNRCSCASCLDIGERGMETHLTYVLSLDKATICKVMGISTLNSLALADQSSPR